ncbi:MAG TPA: efflux RND transporter permease subunit, partial [Hyphomicrobium sp.]|nr:efflux RND transporter permease subunit [Hyphomicrobium sp.]
MKALDIFVRRPVIAIVLNLALVLIGLRAASNLPVQQYPRIESSSIVITTIYVGASAETIRGFVTTPIERAVSSLTGIDYVESSSVPGLSTVTARLKLNQPSTTALAEVGNRLDQIRSELPLEIESPVVEVQRADRPYATFYVSVTSDVMKPAEVTDYLIRNIQPRLSTIPNVQRVGLEGSRPQAMRIWLDAERLSAFGLNATDVEAALRRNNFLAAVGRAKSNEIQVDLLADTDLRKAEEFERLIVREDGDRIIRISDLGRVELGAEEEISNVRHNGKDAVYLSVWPLPGTNEIKVAQDLRREIKLIAPDLPQGMEIALAYDGAVYMENSIKEILTTFAETVAIVGLIVFAFLGSWRSALVPLVTIPISLIGAMAAMMAMGFSLNLLTLLAIVLSVGLVVDDAIVVV